VFGPAGNNKRGARSAYDDKDDFDDLGRPQEPRPTAKTIGRVLSDAGVNWGHSCDPNAAVAECYGDFVTVRATRHISKGEKVKLSYADFT
jgi:hypothetical protein